MTLELEIVKIIAIILALLLAIIGHEIMHGWTAYRFGDNTAKSQGRLSINPIKHIDPIGSLLLPGFLFVVGSPFLFGWAKPVPVNMHTVIRNRGTKGAMGVSLAGISYNFALVAIFAFIYSMMGEPSNLLGIFISIFIMQSIIINAVLGFFNLWPIPPLDGSQALRYFAQGKRWNRLVAWLDKIYPYGMFILIAIIATPIASYAFKPLLWLLAQILQ
ncbi:MAG: site-2 protease family protein [Sulfurovaceae bacterium]